MLKIIVLLLIFYQSVSAQTGFQKTLGGEKFDRGMFINHTLDGGYIICGYSNSFSSSDDLYAAKLDAKGIMQWQKNFGGKGNDMAWGILELKDGSFLLHGTVEIDSSNDDVLIIKMDKGGNKLWEKSYGNKQRERATQMLALSDGNYLLIGQRTIEDGKNIDSYILKINDDGKLLWEKTYGSGVIERTFYAAETFSGDYLISGLVLPYHNRKADIYLLKLKKTGEEIWAKTYGEENVHDIVHSICLNRDKKTLTLTGYIESGREGFHDALFMQVDEHGNLLTKKMYGTGEDLRLMHSEETTDNGFIVTGYTRKNIAGNLSDAVLLKFNSRGETEWIKTFGTPDKDDQGYWIVNDKDGGFTLIGYTHSIGVNGDIWMIKTNDKGE